ncbi:hypothetical protein BDZ89DRAFT_1060403 [Hymenopellis radicata]|nr:hypothetical protein BDZ89DRAFT_1060403 [Hymenopellis radicata]
MKKFSIISTDGTNDRFYGRPAISLLHSPAAESTRWRSVVVGTFGVLCAQLFPIPPSILTYTTVGSGHYEAAPSDVSAGRPHA